MRNVTYPTLNEILLETSDGLKLAADYTEPPMCNSWVIMCHGISSHKKEYLDMFDISAKLLAEHGIGTLKFDFRGHGASEGAQADFSIIGQMIDIDAAIKWILDNAASGSQHISYLGVSFGGGVGVLYDYAEDVFASISLFAPVLDFGKTFITPSTRWAKSNFTPETLSRAKADGYLLLDGEFHIGRRLIAEMMFLDPLCCLQDKSYSKPVQIFHGDADNLVPASITSSALSSNAQLDIKILKGVGHGLYVDGDDDGKTEQSRAIQEIYYSSLVSYFRSSLKT